MARFFNPQSADEDGNMQDKRLHAPATARNKDVILSVLQDHFPTSGTVLELASGTGEHACHFAAGLQGITWQPTDIDDGHLDSIKAWRDQLGINNISDPFYLNALDEWPSIDDLQVVTAINLIHISPWEVCKNLIAKAGLYLPKDGVLFLYGPYKRDGKHTSPSNEAFDASLKSRNPDWGVRDLETVTGLADKAGFTAPVITQMPANNLSVIFRKK